MAMGAVGRTAPLSGTEHVISHLLDMSAGASGEPPGLHGAQVGVAAVIAACVWERMLDRVTPADFETPAPDPDVAQEMVEKAFAPVDPSGAMARECWADVEKKLASWDAVDRRSAAKTWETLAPRLAAAVRDPAVIVAALDAAGSATRFSRLDPQVDAERARWAVASAPLMRNRFTVVDLALLTGCWGEEDIDAVLDRAASVGAGL
jgi:glycerol-1-phosphate dehydrogenase [NAD(P)+]